MAAQPDSDVQPKGGLARALAFIEKVGNKLPDPAILFVLALLLTWAASWLLAGASFAVPSKGGSELREVVNLLTPESLTTFLADMVKTFTGFHPLGVVLVALLGVGVAEHSGFVNAALKGLLRITPRSLLTPMLVFVAVLSHTAADAGYVLVIPLGGIIFYAAGRHPLAGIAAAFAGVSGGFSANPVPSSLDPLLQGLTEAAAGMLDPTRTVNPLCNWMFTGLSTLVIVGVAWYVTDRIIEPRLAGTPVEHDGDIESSFGETTPQERRGLRAGGLAMLVGLLALALWAWPSTSALRAQPTGELTATTAPLMKAIVPFIFLLFLIPGVVHGYVSGTFRSHRDVIGGMSKTMSTMGYYLVMAFFASLFIYAFNQSQIGALLAVRGAELVRALALPGPVTLLLVIALCGSVNLVIGSASAKWALLAPILVPMLMQLGLAPELTQAAYRVGDSTTNIITPLMPYFPLVVAFAQRYNKRAGIGTLVSLMLPYTLLFAIAWIGLLLGMWALDIPLGVQGAYAYP